MAFNIKDLQIRTTKDKLRTPGRITETPDATPDYMWHGQFTDLVKNSNKQWIVQTWNSDNVAVVTYGQTNSPQTQEFYDLDSYDVHKKVRSKQKKGYKEVDIATEADIITARQRQNIVVDDNNDDVAPIQVHPSVLQLIDLLWEESGEYIDSYFAGSVGSLSIKQIDEGRNYLQLASNAIVSNNKQALIDAVTKFYTTIPTKLPRTGKNQFDIDEIIKLFKSGLQARTGDSLEDRLDQLETALAMNSVTNNVGASKSVQRYTSLGTIIEPLDKHALAYEQIVKFIKRTFKNAYVENIFLVELPAERVAFQSMYSDFYQKGKLNVQSMFHASRNANFRHILRTGLAIPKVISNGWRFGPGIYFSDAAMRSYMYTGTTNYRSSVPKMMVVNDVNIGNPWQSSGSDSSLRTAPKGYDSVHGTGAWSGRGDEFIVYNTAQQTIRALVLLNEK